MGAAHRSERAGIISKPAQRDRGDLIVPDQRRADPAVDKTHRDNGRNCRDQENGDRFQHAVVGLAKCFHLL